MPWIKPNWPAPANVHAFTTTRTGGVSQGPYASFNLGLHVDDQPEAVEKNRHILLETAQLPEPPRWLTQYHSTVMLRGEDVSHAPKADATYTQTPGIVLAIMTADCLPLLICHRDGSVIAAIHAGWRGLLAGVITQNLEMLAIAPEDCLVWLGPAIGMPHYPIGPEVRDQFLATHTSAAAFHWLQGQWHMDLYKVAREQLEQLGITHIYGGDHCTYTESERFFSYRRDGVTGRMASLIWIANQ